MARLEFEQDPVHVKTAAVVEVTERTLNRKRFLFQIDLEWSDGNKTSSFRSYSDFFDFQCGLLTAFPREGGLEKGHERIIPFLPGKKWFSRNTRGLAEQRLPEIREYVQRLIALPQHISKSEDVVTFFRSNWQEDRLRRGEGRGSLLANGSSTSDKYSVENLSKRRGPPPRYETSVSFCVHYTQINMWRVGLSQCTVKLPIVDPLRYGHNIIDLSYKDDFKVTNYSFAGQPLPTKDKTPY